MMHPPKQRGAALIVALFVMSLVAIAAIAMIERLQMDMHRTQLMINDMHAFARVQGTVAWAMDQLNQNALHAAPNKLMDQTPIVLPLQTKDGAKIDAVIEDAEGRFNINNLVNPLYQEDFSRLIHVVLPSLSLEDAKNITRYVVEWITPAEQHDDDYLTLHPSYRVPHRLMKSVSELRLVKGITPKLYQALLPYMIALPDTTKININNAAAPVLMSLSDTLTLDAANTIASVRVKSPYLSVEQFSQNSVVQNNGIPLDKVSVQSNFFLIKSNVKVEQQKLVVYTLLQRVQKNKKPKEIILFQTRGTL